MTHGEAWFKATRYENLDLSENYHKSPAGLPKSMSREEASVYYNTKFHDYWLDILNKEAPKRKKKNAMWVKIQMFGHPSNAKLLKETK